MPRLHKPDGVEAAVRYVQGLLPGLPDGWADECLPEGWIEVDRHMSYGPVPTHPETGEPHPNPVHWFKVQRLALDLARQRCELWWTHKGRLHVHHRTYVRWGHERVEDLTVLCETCHLEWHAREREKLRRAA